MTEPLTVEQRRTVPHDPDEGCPTYEHCFFCNVDEPLQPGDYRVCGECLHVFRTAEELLARHNQLLAEFFGAGYPAMEPATDPEQVWTCPLCAHDF